MRTLLDKLFAIFLGTYWRHRLADEHAVFIAHIGLSHAEEEALLALRNRR
jgi:hypothetical protein